MSKTNMVALDEQQMEEWVFLLNYKQILNRSGVGLTLKKEPRKQERVEGYKIYEYEQSNSHSLTLRQNISPIKIPSFIKSIKWVNFFQMSFYGK